MFPRLGLYDVRPFVICACKKYMLIRFPGASVQHLPKRDWMLSSVTPLMLVTFPVRAVWRMDRRWPVMGENWLVESLPMQILLKKCVRRVFPTPWRLAFV